MAGINKVIIVGRLGAKPELRTTQTGLAVCNLSVATSESWNDQTTGERREQTEWHRIILFRRQAEVAAQYLDKGSLVFIEGKLQTRKYQDQNGYERYLTEIIGDTMQMLEGKNAQGQGNYHGSYQHQGGNAQNNNYPQSPFNQNGKNAQNNRGGYQQSGNYQPRPPVQTSNNPPINSALPEMPTMDDDDIPF